MAEAIVIGDTVDVMGEAVVVDSSVDVVCDGVDSGCSAYSLLWGNFLHCLSSVGGSVRQGSKDPLSLLPQVLV